jgi:hypothetical protein
MSIDPALVYEDQMILAVRGTRPAILHQPADRTRLAALARRLSDAEIALTGLRAKGYGRTGMTLVEIVDALPVVSK